MNFIFNHKLPAVFMTTLFLVIGLAFLFSQFVVAGGPPEADLPLRGFLWSASGTGAVTYSGTGWVSFCGGMNIPSCPGTSIYQVVVNNDTGEFRGHAWSSNFGWLSFERNETGPPPAEPFNGSETYLARIDPLASPKEMKGWARFLAGCDFSIDTNGDGAADRCNGSGPGPNTGVWDGWVRFGNDNGQPDYFSAITTDMNGLEDGNGRLIGFGWGGSSVGWLATKNEALFHPSPQTPLPILSATLSVNPQIGRANRPVTFTAVVDTRSRLPITYEFICDGNGVNPDKVIIRDSNATTMSAQCTYGVGTYRPMVEISQGGVFKNIQKDFLITNPQGGNDFIVKYGLIKEISPDDE